MSDKLELKHLESMIKQLEQPMNHDCRQVINRATYDNYKEMFNLTDDQMNKYWIVSDYIKKVKNVSIK